MPVYKIKYKKADQNSMTEVKQFGFDRCHAISLLKRRDPEFDGSFEVEEAGDHAIYCDVVYDGYSGVVVDDYATGKFYIRAAGPGYCIDADVPIDKPQKIQREFMRRVREHLASAET